MKGKEMHKRVWLSRLSLVGGVLVLLIGVLHAAATPMIYRGVHAVIPDKALGVSYFFGVMGLYVAFAGSLMLACSRALARGESWAWALSLGNGVCNVLAGVGAMAVGFRHSLVLVWLLVAMSISVLALATRRDYRTTARSAQPAS
jgi:hypothetical protein